MTTLQQDAHLATAREEISIARALIDAAQRLLSNAEFALGNAAARSDTISDFVIVLAEAHKLQATAIAALQRTEKTVLEFMKEKTEP